MIAYWIAFGNHGPRALTPPGENRQVFFWTMFWIGVSCVIFVVIRGGARGPSITMTKEWQEATNEYLKVYCPFIAISLILIAFRHKTLSPLVVYHQKVIKGRAMYRSSEQSYDSSLACFICVL